MRLPRVVVETRVRDGRIRPDLLLMRQGAAVAAIEVLVSHAVSDEKASSRADLAWAPAGRDGRGRGVVVVDGLGVYRAEQFVRLFARGDRRLRPEAIRAKLAERVALLGGAI